MQEQSKCFSVPNQDRLDAVTVVHVIYSLVHTRIGIFLNQTINRETSLFPELNKSRNELRTRSVSLSKLRAECNLPFAVAMNLDMIQHS